MVLKVRSIIYHMFRRKYMEFPFFSKESTNSDSGSSGQTLYTWYRWSGWTEWSSCSATCDDGTRSRERICNHTVVSFVNISVNPELTCEELDDMDRESNACLLQNCTNIRRKYLFCSFVFFRLLFSFITSQSYDCPSLSMLL